METIEGVEVHPAASAFPLMQGKEFTELVEDVKKNGIIQPLLYRNGTLVDGRNRLKAAIKAGIPLKDIPRKSLASSTTDEEVYEFVFSMNYQRRHLTDAQRAAIKIKMMEESGELAKEEKIAREKAIANRSKNMQVQNEAKKTGTPAPKASSTGSKGHVATVVAKKAGVSVATAQNVLHVKKTKPEKFKRLADPKAPKLDNRGKGARTHMKAPDNAKECAKFLAGRWTKDECLLLCLTLQKLLKLDFDPKNLLS